jgi:hypothetical protein
MGTVEIPTVPVQYRFPPPLSRTHVQLFGAQMAHATLVAISGPKKVSIFRPPPKKNGPCYGFASLKTTTFRTI